MGTVDFYGWLQNIFSMRLGLPEILLLTGGFLLLVFIVWLLLRVPRLWYWKVNRRNERLDAIKTEIGSQGAKVERIAEVLEQIMQEGLSIKDQEGYSGAAAQVVARDAAPIAIGPEQEESLLASCKEYCRGKSGKLYSREDIERLIRE